MKIQLFEVDPEHRQYVRLYKGADNSYGTITIFTRNNKRLPDTIGSDYVFSTDFNQTFNFESFCWKIQQPITNKH